MTQDPSRQFLAKRLLEAPGQTRETGRAAFPSVFRMVDGVKPEEGRNGVEAEIVSSDISLSPCSQGPTRFQLPKAIGARC